MNIKKLFRTLVNFLVPTPQTVRKHRAPSARFRALAARAASHGDTLTRDGRSYTLTTSDLRVLEFDNLAQVRSYLAEATGVSGNHCFGPHPMRAVPATIATADSGTPHPFKIGALSPAVAQGDCYSLGEPPARLGNPEFMDRCDGGPYPGDADYVERPRDMYIEPGPARDVGSAKPFVPAVATPITNDIVRE